MESLESEELVAQCNSMMAAAGLVAKARTLDDVRGICSSTSVFVAALESLLGSKLPDIERKPRTLEHRAANCTAVVKELERQLSAELQHIDGGRIVAGNLRDIANLIELLCALPKPKGQQSQKDHKQDHETSDRMRPPKEQISAESKGRSLSLLKHTVTAHEDSEDREDSADSIGQEGSSSSGFQRPGDNQAGSDHKHGNPSTSDKVPRGQSQKSSNHDRKKMEKGSGGDRVRHMKEWLEMAKQAEQNEQNAWQQQVAVKEKEVKKMRKKAFAPRWPFTPSAPFPDLGLETELPEEAAAKHRRRKRLLKATPPKLVTPPRHTPSTLEHLKRAYSALLPHQRRSKSTPRRRAPPKRATYQTPPAMKPDSLQELPLWPGIRRSLEVHFSALKRLQEDEQRADDSEERQGPPECGHLAAWEEHVLFHPDGKGIRALNLAQKLQRHDAKVQRIRAKRFQEEVAADQQSRKLSRDSQEEAILRSLLQQAVALEKKAVLERKQQERLEKVRRKQLQMTDQQKLEAYYMTRCEELEERLAEQRKEREEAARAQGIMLKKLVKEDQKRIEAEQRALYQKLTSQEEAATFRKMDLQITSSKVLDQVAQMVRKAAAL